MVPLQVMSGHFGGQAFIGRILFRGASKLGKGLFRLLPFLKQDTRGERGVGLNPALQFLVGNLTFGIRSGGGGGGILP